MNSMTKFDLGPWNRSTVGFDRIFEHFADARNSYPPYNIVKLDENKYAIEVAVAGFRENNIEIVVKENKLSISGKIEKNNEPNYLYKGISTREFTSVFTLGDYVQVKNAIIENGLLTLSLEREIPEESKPRLIPVTVK